MSLVHSKLYVPLSKYFALIFHRTVFQAFPERWTANQLEFVDKTRRLDGKTSHESHPGKCRACVTCAERRWRFWRGVSRWRARNERAEHRGATNGVKKATSQGKVYKYDGASDTPARGVADRAAWGSWSRASAHFCLSPTTVTHVTHVTGPRLDLWTFIFFFFLFSLHLLVPVCAGTFLWVRKRRQLSFRSYATDVDRSWS